MKKNDELAWKQIEQLFGIYETSLPDISSNDIALLKAKPENQLKFSEIVYNQHRQIAKNNLETAIRTGIISKQLIYPDMKQWFWQSKKYKNLILPRWLFTNENNKCIRHASEKFQGNELWDRNITARRLREFLLHDHNALQSENIRVYDCLKIIYEELSEYSPGIKNFFSDELLNEMLDCYWNSICCSKYKTKKAEIGQYIAKVKKSKTANQKAKALYKMLEYCPVPENKSYPPKWNNAYRKFVNYRTMLFIDKFICAKNKLPEEYDDKTINAYIQCNLPEITEYIDAH